MGGGTAIRVAHSDNRVKCLLTLDPFLFPLKEELMNKKFQNFKNNFPVFLLNTYSFHR